MEIIFKTTKDKSNFAFCSELYKNKKTLNGFNKLKEMVICEPISEDEFECRDVKFDETINGTLYICYPLSVVAKFDIKFNSLHTLITEIRKAYKEIYKNRKTMINCGVWGHDIYDLVIESINVCEGNLVDVNIGS